MPEIGAGTEGAPVSGGDRADALAENQPGTDRVRPEQVGHVVDEQTGRHP